MIPAVGHFCWIGQRLPFAFAISVRSAALSSELDRVVLHHTDPLDDDDAAKLLRATDRVTLRRIDSAALLEQAVPFAGELVDIYREVQSPVALSNMLRAAVVVVEGGVYLDMDTVTIRSLRPLLAAEAFLGLEQIVRPYRVHSSRSPLKRGWSTALSIMRNGLRLAPGGYRVFRWIAPLYYRALNGAVLGGQAGSPLLVAYLRAMTQLPAERRQVKHALGTHLLQQTVDAEASDGLVIHPPDTFYPVAPEIAEHLFRPIRKPDLAPIIRPQTRVLHWYASGRTANEYPKVNPDYIRTHHRRQLYSALVLRFL
jgi:hypothetical protein